MLIDARWVLSASPNSALYLWRSRSFCTWLSVTSCANGRPGRGYGRWRGNGREIGCCKLLRRSRETVPWSLGAGRAATSLASWALKQFFGVLAHVNRPTVLLAISGHHCFSSPLGGRFGGSHRLVSMPRDEIHVGRIRPESTGEPLAAGAVDLRSVADGHSAGTSVCLRGRGRGHEGGPRVVSSDLAVCNVSGVQRQYESISIAKRLSTA